LFKKPAKVYVPKSELPPDLLDKIFGNRCRVLELQMFCAGNGIPGEEGGQERRPVFGVLGGK
jgi:hypothetical protein